MAQDFVFHGLSRIERKDGTIDLVLKIKDPSSSFTDKYRGVWVGKIYRISALSSIIQVLTEYGLLDENLLALVEEAKSKRVKKITQKINYSKYACLKTEDNHAYYLKYGITDLSVKWSLTRQQTRQLCIEFGWLVYGKGRRSKVSEQIKDIDPIDFKETYRNFGREGCCKKYGISTHAVSDLLSKFSLNGRLLTLDKKKELSVVTHYRFVDLVTRVKPTEDIDRFMKGFPVFKHWYPRFEEIFGSNQSFDHFRIEDPETHEHAHYWLKGYGFILPSSWRAVCSEGFLSNKFRWEEEMYQRHFTSGLYQLFKKDPEFCEFVKTKEYLSLPSGPQFKSHLEDEISNDLRSFGLDVVQSLRCIRSPSSKSMMEIDIAIFDRKVGFELNGGYWHCSLYHDKDYHRIKTEEGLKMGYKIYHYWPDLSSKDLIESSMLAKLGVFKERYFARKLQLRQVDPDMRYLFFEENHLHGDVKAMSCLGLFDDKELISAMSFREHPEGMEIARYASKQGCVVVGGFEKLLSHCGYSVVVSYCDRDTTPDYHDSVYFKHGFEFLGDSGPILRYWNGKTIVDRRLYQKHKLPSLFPGCDMTKSADDILAENKVFPVWNSGNWKFKKILFES